MSSNELKSLREIFEGRFYRIPDYQRGYAWEESHLEDFWDDLIRIEKRPEAVHYTGMLTVERISQSCVENDSAWIDEKPYFKQGMKAYYVIDGQQRLTTSIILINVLLNTFLPDELIIYESKTYWQNIFLYKAFEGFNSYRFGYIKDMPSYEFFKTHVLGQESLEASNLPEDTLYTKNLRFAKSFFETKISTFDSAQVQALFKCLITSFKFNFYEINSDLDVFVAFETMNNRGKPLSHLELLKNRLIYLSTLLNDPQLRLAINSAWRTVYEHLGKPSRRELKDDDFLRDHWIMYFPKYNREEEKAYASFLLGEHFTTKGADAKTITSGHILDYVKSIQISIKHWYSMFNPEVMTDQYVESKNVLLRLNHLRFAMFQPLIISALSKAPSDSDLAKLLLNIERFNFVVLLISRRRSNTQSSRLYKTAHECYMNSTNIGELADSLRKLTNEWASIPYFKSYLQDLFKSGKGFYSWNGLRYFLFEYETSLIPKTNGAPKVLWEECINKTLEESVEHIYPQNPENEEWLNTFTEYESADQETLKNSLGNLLILSRSSNASASRRTFAEKCMRINSQGQRVGYANGSYSEIQVSQDYADGWNANAILTRGLKLLGYLEKTWEIDLGDDKSKTEILGLTFLKDTQQKN